MSEALKKLQNSLPSGAMWVTGEWLKSLIQALLEDRARLMNGSGTEIPSASGRWFQIDGAGGSGNPSHPFKLIVTGEHSVRVVFGDVNSEIPDGMSEGDEPQYVLTVAGTGSIWLVVTTDPDGDITSVSIDSGPTMPDDEAGLWHRRIGTFTHNDDDFVQVAQSISGSQALEVCGGVSPNWGLV